MNVFSIFHPVKVKEWKTNGRSRWVVDGRQNGKFKRIQFDTKGRLKPGRRPRTRTPPNQHGGSTLKTESVLTS